MRRLVTQFGEGHPRHDARGLALRAIWALVRVPLLALLVILEPVARLILTGFALLMTLTAFFWAAVGGLSAMTFWRLLGLGVGAWLLLALYYALLRALST